MHQEHLPHVEKDMTGRKRRKKGGPVAETGTAAKEPYDCIIPSVHDHHLLVKVALGHIDIQLFPA